MPVGREGAAGMGRLVQTGESVCLKPPGPQEQAPGGEGGTWFPAGVGGTVQPSQAFQSAQCGGWAPGGRWLGLATPPEAPWLSRPGRLAEAPPKAGKPLAARSQCVPRESAHKREAPPSRMFALGVHKGHENFPRESTDTCAPAGHATPPGGAGHAGTPVPARSPPYAPEPGIPWQRRRWGH